MPASLDPPGEGRDSVKPTGLSVNWTGNSVADIVEGIKARTGDLISLPCVGGGMATYRNLELKLELDF
jgi:hypothetical protein